MTDFEFWQKIKEFGQMTYDWWYPTIALPAFILALSAVLLSIFSARKVKKVHTRFLMLLIATLPMILTFPAVYTTVNLRSALQRVDVTLPDQAIDFPVSQALVLGGALNAFALWAVIGTTLVLPVLWSGLVLGDVPVISPAARSFTKKITNIATRVVGRSGRKRIGSSPYGTFRINKGQRTGAIEVLKPNTILGRSSGNDRSIDIPLPDQIVSRQHVKIMLHNNNIAIMDAESSYGTYIVRAGQAFELNGQPIELQHEDKVYLGDPNFDESIELVYERPAQAVEEGATL